MHTHPPSKTKNDVKNFMQLSNLRQLAIHTSTTSRKQTISKKGQATSAAKGKQKKMEKVDERPSTIENTQEIKLLYQQEGVQGDSDFEFSAEIMEHNPRQESRETRQKGKLCHLTIYDWMMRVSTLLKLSKECFYRGIIIMKKFMFLDQKQPTFKVNLSNVNIYALAALLIASKFQNINGNFLANVSHIADEKSSQINKQSILECEMYIMSILRFRIANCSIIVETIFAVINTWNEATFHTNLAAFKFARLEEFENLQEKQQDNEQNVVLIQRKGLLQRFVYLVDFMLMRKLVELRVKDIKTLENSTYFRKIISNVILHIASYLISISQRQIQTEQLKSYRKVVSLLAKRLQIPRTALERTSHVLSKQIRCVFSKTTIKYKQLEIVQISNESMMNNYCVCHLRLSSIKYNINEYTQKQGNTTYPPEYLARREEEHQTDPFAYLCQNCIPNKQQIANQSVLGLQKGYLLMGLISKQCRKCSKSSGMVGKLINNQFYVPLLGKKQ